MLTSLHIQNYALIDDCEIVFNPGFDVLTGETGAGKSIVIGALNLVLGGRASAETLRGGARQVKIDGVFDTANPSPRLKALLKEHSIETDQDELILSRVVTAEGRSRACAGGSPVPVAVLAAIGDELVDIHGQHDHQSLLKADRQLDLIDAFADAEADAAALSGQVRELRTLERRIEELEHLDRERLRRVEFLKHEAAEIDAAGLQPGEEEDLRGQRNLVANAERICALATKAGAALYEREEHAAVLALDAALGDLAELAAIDPRFGALADRLRDARGVIEEAAADLRQYAAQTDFDASELDGINHRLSLIADLKRKYGGSIDAILEYRAQAKAEIDTFESRDRLLADARQQRDALEAHTMAAAARLSATRKRAARKLEKQVTEILQILGMKGGCLKAAFSSQTLTYTGVDALELLLSANQGEAPKPLRQVASGGELSRIMLALKSVSARADKIPTLIFDEIDAGVGGHTARHVAAQLAQLACSHQVVCVTHVAQIAAAANHHLRVNKERRNGRTATDVSPIAGDERTDEIARLLDGSLSDVSRGHARALLEEYSGASAPRATIGKNAARRKPPASATADIKETQQ